ncbi:MAG: polysaccharide deacetylase family protein [Proteobacteria bacterium]|nr:polysaccharide deacetylase family protein [Pseudomonadota bacterium]
MLHSPASGRGEERRVSSATGFLRAAGLEFAYFSGLARLREGKTGGAGAILRFERVRPVQSGRFQPLRAREITPEFLEQIIQALKHWKFDVVPMDEVCRRSRQPKAGHRFVALTFDGGYRDVLTHAYPVLTRHAVPFAVYLSTSFPDGLGEAWWLALQDVIARHGRISLMMHGREQHFSSESVIEKHELYDFLANWMQSLAPAELSTAIHDLCKRYSVDLAAVSRDASMTWQDVATLAADPQVTIGSATVNSPMLTALPDDAALREVSMGKAVAQAALGREVRHFAYPFGHPGSFNAKHVLMAERSGFASAVSSMAGTVAADGRSNPYALPRVSWDGRRRSLRALRVMLSGVRFGA